MSSDQYVVVSKADVIKAIQTENLKSGMWFGGLYNEEEKGIEICHVCAVGAVMRHVLDESETTFLRDVKYYKLNTFVGNKLSSDIGIANGFYGDCIVENDFVKAAAIVKIATKKLKQSNSDYDELRVLSGLFESLCHLRESENLQKHGFSSELSRHQMYRIKQILIKFVEDNFPKKIKVPVNGFAVRPGLKKKS